MILFEPYGVFIVKVAVPWSCTVLRPLDRTCFIGRSVLVLDVVQEDGNPPVSARSITDCSVRYAQSSNPAWRPVLRAALENRYAF